MFRLRGWLRIGIKECVVKEVIVLLLAVGCAARAEHKPIDADCLACHADASLTKDINGKSVSLYVDKDKLRHSIHGGMFSCVDCHTDVKGLVHSETPKKITCAQCHADAQEAYSHSYHAKAAKGAAITVRKLPGLPRRRTRSAGD